MGLFVSVALAVALAAPLGAQRAAKPPSAPTPHWPDGRVNFGPEPGGKGHWDTGVGNLSEADVKMNGAFLVNPADIDKIAPFQPWAKALVQYRFDTSVKTTRTRAAFHRPVRGSSTRRTDLKSSTNPN